MKEAETRSIATATTFAADVEARLNSLRALLTADMAASALEVEGRFKAINVAVDGIRTAQQQCDADTKTSIAVLDEEVDRRLKAIDGVIAAVQKTHSADYAKVLHTLSHQLS